MFTKVCKKCNNSFESHSRNKQFCSSCSGYKPKGSTSKYTSNLFKDDLEGYSYFMGFCYADGYMHKTRDLLYVLSTDKEILEKIKDRMAYQGDIGVNRKGTDRTKECYSLLFYADNARYFRDCGLVEKKNLVLPKGIDFYHFLRGLLDGDGTIVLRRLKYTWGINYVGFLGNKELLYQIQQVVGGSLREHHGTYLLQISGSKAYYLLDKIYENASIYLERKYNKYISLGSSVG